MGRDAGAIDAGRLTVERRGHGRDDPHDEARRGPAAVGATGSGYRGECGPVRVNRPYELYFGAYKSQKVSYNLETIRLLLGDFIVLPFDDEDSRQAGEIRAELKKSGEPIGPYDVLVAGQARARNLILISNNVQGYQRVPDLQLEDWALG